MRLSDLQPLRTLAGDLAAGLAEMIVRVARAGVLAGRAILVGLAAFLSRLARQPRSPGLGVVRRGLRGLVLTGFSVACAVGIMGLAVNGRFADSVLPKRDVDLWTINRQPSLTILDRNGEVLGRRGARVADPVPIEELPPYLVEAFLATEDRRFFDHSGFDLRGLARAAVANFRARSVVEGGSTITQQLAKNLFLKPEKTLLRKLEELQYALWLEARLTKSEILSLYLNRTYLGAGAYGVEAAAQAYFSKSARDVTIAEAALLAGLPQAPSYLDPTSNPEGAHRRATEVIENLVETGHLDEVSAGIAKAIPATIAPTTRGPDYGYFLDYIQADLSRRLGAPQEDLIILTTLDPQLQRQAEAAVLTHINEDSRELGAEQAALIAFDPAGGIVAMVGGTDYRTSLFNRATSARRQPGSAFKPFVFLAAMEAGLSPQTLVIDRPIKVGKWEPTNYNGYHLGPLRLDSAAARSTNSIAVQLTEGIGRERIIDAARRAGITEPLKPLPSLALGAFELTLHELTAAYLPLADHGREKSPHGILRVENRHGKELYAFSSIEDYYVLEPDKADDTARLLQAVMTRGTGRRGQFGGHDLAGKTGTTNDWHDAWFIGFSRYYTVGVWVGNDENRGMAKISGSTIPLSIWKDFMVAAHEGKSPRPLFDDGADNQARPLRDVGSYYSGLQADLYQIAAGQPNYPWAGGSREPSGPNDRGFFQRVFGIGDDRRGDPSQQTVPGPSSVNRVRGEAATGVEAPPVRYRAGRRIPEARVIGEAAPGARSTAE
ncbi:hypothetical protein PB2503_08049 [Parvularcula bermudensis HTCC2503]|uniref:Uncharacterized protein n=1 Tax=Parvularcula bermudensis (strain ATCC BAA-594 / HTCC2503 / KCTC 12087) TaxID=314260 RepID=E0TH81_PARBH|nr:PBP1A family penicillin-binding protein [Parvularcula bermudensis]ADM09665.1 hypothetical protein PB2503_08049 [Parvularcula bermudensis HTCC2503]